MQKIPIIWGYENNSCILHKTSSHNFIYNSSFLRHPGILSPIKNFELFQTMQSVKAIPYEVQRSLTETSEFIIPWSVLLVLLSGCPSLSIFVSLCPALFDIPRSVILIGVNETVHSSFYVLHFLLEIFQVVFPSFVQSTVCVCSSLLDIWMEVMYATYKSVYLTIHLT